MSTDVYQEVTDVILAELAKGVAPWRKPWTSRAGELPSNLKSRKAYRGINQLLLSLMPYASPWWLTFKQARELGGCVRKGEKSTLVIFWKQLKIADPDTDRGFRMIPMIRYYRVFNAEQCDDINVPEIADLPDFDPVSEAERLLEPYRHPVGPEVRHGGNSACWVPAWDMVRMPLREAFDTPAHYYSTLFHELTHSTGNAERLNRSEITSGSISFGDDKYGREELTAEFGAAMLTAHAGLLNVTLPESASYIDHWSKVIKADPKMIVMAAARAQRAADLIMGVKYEERESSPDRVAVAA